jgi:quinoprotein dehydrogenase-associated probable ABC transporter substrate-binding protein
MPSHRCTLAVLVGVMSLVATSFIRAPDAMAASAEAVDHSALRVCADPNNLPFSNDKGEGYENKIADLLAKDLGVPVQYTYYPDSVGFIRNTLRARKCDIVIGTISGNDLVQNTNPYYRSSFSLIYRKDSGIKADSFDDPALQTLQIGVIAGTPPTTIMAQKGLLANVHSYQLLVDTRFDAPPRDLVNDVAAGKIDVGILWGPIAGYYAKQQSTPLVVVPLKTADNPIPLDYRITMGVRFNEPDWKRQINDLIRKEQPAITKILLDYGVPLIDDMGAPITQ